MNKCSCYVVAEKLTLSDLARDFYLIIQIYLVQRREIMRKTTNELYTPTQRRGNKLTELHRELRSLYFVSSLHRPTQLFLLTKFMYRKKAHSKLFRYLFLYTSGYLLCVGALDKSYIIINSFG